MSQDWVFIELFKLRCICIYFFNSVIVSFRSKMATPFPLSGFVITISLFFLRFRKSYADVVTWTRFIGKIREMHFYLIFSFLGNKVLLIKDDDLFKSSKDFLFSNFF